MKEYHIFNITYIISVNLFQASNKIFTLRTQSFYFINPMQTNV